MKKVLSVLAAVALIASVQSCKKCGYCDYGSGITSGELCSKDNQAAYDAFKRGCEADPNAKWVTK